MTVMIGIDPHKPTHTAVAIDDRNRTLDQLRVVANRRQIPKLLAWADRFEDRRWAVEGAGGLGRLVAVGLVSAGEHVVDAVWRQDRQHPAHYPGLVRRPCG
jgi:transposase